ncbi:MAG: hypothetical protein ACYC0V_06720 [Armatimonadota bacterium]
MDSFFAIMIAIFSVPIIAIIFGVLYKAYDVSLRHKREMATIRKKENPDVHALTTAYQEFVLGVDARIQRLEDRIRLLEGKLRQEGQSDDTQQIRRG